MAKRKRYSVEQIIRKLREAEVELARGQKVPQVCRKLGISEQTYYRWRKEYGGLKLGPRQAARSHDSKSSSERCPGSSGSSPISRST